MYAQRLTGCGQHRDTTPSVAIASELRGEGDGHNTYKPVMELVVGDAYVLYNGIGGGRYWHLC